MGIDLTVTKGYGILIPLIGNEEIYHRLLDDDEEFKFYELYRDYEFGVSGSFWMAGPEDGDVIWVAPKRLTESDDPKHSGGFVWTFDEVPTEQEVATLQLIAEKVFSMPTVVKVEPFVALSVY